MRLLHYSIGGGPVRIGARQGEAVIDVARAYARANMSGSLPPTIDGLLREGALAKIAPVISGAGRDLAVDMSRAHVHSPILTPQKILGVGLNYVDHTQETGTQVPGEPIFFAKWGNTVSGPTDPIRMPKVTKELDWEGELVFVIGKPGRDISEDDAMGHVAGYTVGNDVSARDWQIRKPQRQWLLGKTFDTFCPMGPDLVTVDEIPDPYALQLKCEVSGEVMQDAVTDLHFKIPTLVSYVSQVVTLEPGDVFLTGTPGGVGMGRTPPRWLQPGDVVVTSIEGLGSMRNPVVA
ncbi:MAG: fumarylacetoacetate hydrolase family protein [Chloroflexota bacterium]|nr:fumarylacetoacetate hydrolase family protein [Chloroflexota bacterium]